MKTQETKSKLMNITYCSNCNYFPTLSELNSQRVDFDIFRVQWRCRNCSSHNIHPTDQDFKQYCINSNFLIDSNEGSSKKMTILIHIGLSSNDTYINMPMHPKIMGIDDKTKKQMCEESVLLTALENAHGLQQRRKRGRSFSWSILLNRRETTKIQYALWFAQQISKQIGAHIVLCSNSGTQVFEEEQLNKFDTAIFIQYLRRGLSVFYNTNDRNLQSYLKKQDYVLALFGSERQLLVSNILYNIKGQTIIFDEFDQFEPKDQAFQMKSQSSVVIHHKSASFDENRKVCTQKAYLKELVKSFTVVKFESSIFLGKATKFHRVFHKSLYDHNQSQYFDLEGLEPEILPKEKIRNLKSMIQFLNSRIEQQKQKQNCIEIKNTCCKFAQKVPSNIQVRIFLQFFCQKTNNKTTIFFANSFQDESPQHQEQAYFNIMEYLNLTPQNFQEYFLSAYAQEENDHDA